MHYFIQVGTIVGLRFWNMDSRIATLFLHNENQRNKVFADTESGSVQALAQCFGASEDRADLTQKIKGRRIVYMYDEIKILKAFMPVEDYDGPEIPPGGIVEEIDELTGEQILEGQIQ